MPTAATPTPATPDEFQDEWAVPCLDRDNCRSVHRTREAAEAHARAEGVSVIEHRTVTPWRPVLGWP